MLCDVGYTTATRTAAVTSSARACHSDVRASESGMVGMRGHRVELKHYMSGVTKGVNAQFKDQVATKLTTCGVLSYITGTIALNGRHLPACIKRKELASCGSKCYRLQPELRASVTPDSEAQ